MSAERDSLAAELMSAGLDWIVPEWPAARCVRALSTTRNVRAPDRTQDDSADSLDSALAPWLPSPPVWLAQVHGAALHDADIPRTSPERPRADACITRRANVVCAIQTADCLPVLFSDRQGTVVAAAHAGWRGLAAGVLEATLAGMHTDPGAITAWIGPGIGARVYEVGADVRDALCGVDPDAERFFAARAPGKWLADLHGLARRRLALRGVASIHGGPRCTLSEAALFHSYRRDGARAGRMATLIWRTA